LREEGSPLRPVSLHLIVDTHTPRALVADALAGGVDVLQLRDKGASALDLYGTARAILPLARRYGAALLVNDRIDVALAVGADGVHLARRSLPAEAARAVARGLVLGASVHTLDEVAALAPLVDYLTFGHVFPSASHPDLPPKGEAGLRQAVTLSSRPVLAIGGVTPENAAAVVAAGAAGVVVISAIRASPEAVRTATSRLRAALDGATGPEGAAIDPLLTLHQRERS
jgi:thiamine-phosphate diphosphorylase